MPELRRAQQRVTAAMPVKFVGGSSMGITRDISPSGIYFETDEELSSGSPIDFVIEFDNPSGKLLLECKGEIVRIERAGGKVGVAAKILESHLERATEHAAPRDREKSTVAR